ncbi:MAG: hypothetical protein LBE56_12170, partial [Tannerella sp.]|nr:hypothetical protein [Tannerella sp.]
MNSIMNFVLRRIADRCRLTMWTGMWTAVLTVWMITSCETEYIPENPDVGINTLSFSEGNFKFSIKFATYGEEDSQAATRNGQQDSLRALNMEPETDVIRVRDGLFIYATLAVDDRPA